MGESTNTQVLIAGAVAAFTVDLLVYPLDTLKTRYQAAAWQGKQVPGQLFKGLYQGIGSVIFATLPAAGLFFMTYESAKSALGSHLPFTTPQPVIHAIASATAELASCVVLTPAEVLKTNAQMLRRSGPGSGNRSTSIEALHMVWRSSSGPARSLWSGYTALAARNLPFTSIHFPLFEFFRSQLQGWRDRGHERGAKLHGNSVTPLETGLVAGASAALSSALAALITTPSDVVKTRIMASAGSSSTTVGSDKKSLQTGVPGVAKAILRENGLPGLFRGGLLRASWAGLGGGLYLGSYEAAKISLKGKEKTPRPDDGF